MKLKTNVNYEETIFSAQRHGGPVRHGVPDTRTILGIRRSGEGMTHARQAGTTRGAKEKARGRSSVREGANGVARGKGGRKGKGEGGGEKCGGREEKDEMSKRRKMKNF